MLPASMAQTQGEFGEDERYCRCSKELLFAFLHRAATAWSGLATRPRFVLLSVFVRRMENIIHSL
jgi:hypothetical protein